ncbi:MAG: hypothetical protein ACMUHM_04370 [Thermoplasmatota archaeon]
MGRKWMVPLVTSLVCVIIIISLIPNEKSKKKETTDYTFPPKVLSYNEESSYLVSIGSEYYIGNNFSFLKVFDDEIIENSSKVREFEGYNETRYETKYSALKVVTYEDGYFYMVYYPRFPRSISISYLERICSMVYCSIIRNYSNYGLQELEPVLLNNSGRGHYNYRLVQKVGGLGYFPSSVSFSYDDHFAGSVHTELWIESIDFINRQILDPIDINYTEADFKNFSGFIEGEYLKYGTTIFNTRCDEPYPNIKQMNGHVCNQLTFKCNVFNKWRDSITIHLLVDVFSKEPVAIIRYW